MQALRLSPLGYLLVGILLFTWIDPSVSWGQYYPAYPQPAYSPQPQVYAMQAAQAPTIQTPAAPITTPYGLKFNYDTQYGDYLNLQPHSPKWGQFPITLHITFAESMNDQEKAAVLAAIQEWQRYIDIALVNQPSVAKIELNWASQVNNMTDLGETMIIASHADPYGRLIADKAVIKMLDPAKYVNIPTSALKSAVMHQIGHALGIAAHSDNEQDLMAEPQYQNNSSPIIPRAIKSIASKTLSPFIGIPGKTNTSSQVRTGPPPDKLDRRDLNTLFRIYS